MYGNLKYWLNQFRDEMEKKFWARHAKQHAQGRKSVCDVDFDFSKDLDPVHLEAHLKEEIREWLEDGADRTHESIDVANMMFLYWATRRAREDDAAVSKVPKL